MGEVSDYVDSLEGPDRGAVAAVYELALALVPEAEEGRSYGMPALRYRGSPLMSVVRTSKHIGVYPFSPPVLAELARELARFRTTKGSVSFSPDDPLPATVVERLVLARREEIDATKGRSTDRR